MIVFADEGITTSISQKPSIESLGFIESGGDDARYTRDFYTKRRQARFIPCLASVKHHSPTVVFFEFA